GVCGSTAFDRTHERLGVWREELETRGRAVGKRLRCAIDDRIDQPSRRMDDRRRAVTLAVHLIQAAGLEPGRHREGISTGLDEVRERFVEADEARQASRTGSGK